MAKINLAPFISSISGRMGGVVYKNTRFGTALSSYEAPSNPNTSAQQAVRSSFTRATQTWRNLSPVQAGAWNSWASSQNGNLSGFNWFVALTTKWYAVNGNRGTAPVNPPATWFNGDSISIKGSSSNGKLTWTASGNNASGITTALVYQRVSSPNATPNWDNFTTAKYHSFTGGSFTASFDVAPGYYAVGYQFINTKTGQAASPVFQAGIIGPVSLTVVTGGNSNSTTTKKRKSTKRSSAKKSTAKKTSTSTTSAPAAKKATVKKKATKKSTPSTAKKTLVAAAGTNWKSSKTTSTAKPSLKAVSGTKSTAKSNAKKATKSTAKATVKTATSKKTSSTKRTSPVAKKATAPASKPTLKTFTGTKSNSSKKTTTFKKTSSAKRTSPAAKKATATASKPTLKTFTAKSNSSKKTTIFKKATPASKSAKKSIKPAAKKTTSTGKKKAA
ncbi:MAG: hypothetical protein JNK63_10510 [Chthonomonas sp.]|nr:hypothetical protein [Chthonomonas sp.]